MTPRKEIASSLTLILFSAVFLVYTTRYPVDDWENPGPAVFPLLLGTVLLTLSLAQFLHALWALRRGPKEVRPPLVERVRTFLRQNPGEAQVLKLGVVLFLYILLMPWIGFFTCTFVLVVTASRLMEVRGWTRPVVLSVAIGLFCYLLFEVWIKLSFPRGILF